MTIRLIWLIILGYEESELSLESKIEAWTYFGHTYRMLRKYYKNSVSTNPANPYKYTEKYPVGELPGISRGV